MDNIIRIGSAGSYTEKAKLFDVVLSTGAVSESNYARVQSGFEGDITLPSQSLNDKLRASAAKQGIPLIEGNIHSSDVFYRQPPTKKPTYWESCGMSAAACAWRWRALPSSPTLRSWARTPPAC